MPDALSLSLSLSAAALLTFLVGAAHSWLGERHLIGPMLAPENRAGPLARSHFMRQVLRFAWHITSVAWWGSAALFAWLATVPLDANGRAALVAAAATFGVSGVMTLVLSRGRHLAWIAFLAIAALALLPIF